MREILFKAKTLTGEWVEGYLVKAKWYVDEKEMCAIIPIDVCFYPHCEISEWYNVDVNTICQYTGLTDKKLNRKWRGDIFECSNGYYIERYYIEWDKYNLQWEAVCIADSDGNLPLCEFRADEIEVIGNIFDNPELIGGGE